MCGRYYSDKDHLIDIIPEEEQTTIFEIIEQRLKEKYHDTPAEELHLATGEIYPSNVVPILVLEKGKVTPVAMKWGFPAQQEERKGSNGRMYTVMMPQDDVPRADGKKKMTKVIINSRTDTLERKTFADETIVGQAKDALAKRRVVVPTNGFFEWTHPKPSHRPKDKFYFKNPESNVLYLAGVYNLMDYKGVQFPYFSILTTEPNDSVKPFHDRMPVLLERDEVEGWLTGDNVPVILKRVPFALDAFEVEKEPKKAEGEEEAPQTLFDLLG